ncbi:MAG TPA: ROK family protein [Microbacterium sp.]|uniref:ROK family protein n=1 Tax=Microbacterium sp. TaxID=51671 RepID=UPI002B464067|nr:ROK family protein [Microbacterium sp.]HKT57731.1 ROK family protein [Microbacterium sp.]
MPRNPSDGAARAASLDAVLDYAWTAGDFTAADVMDAVGVTRSTAIEATAALVGLGLLDELPNARDAGDYRMGRPARRFAFRPGAGILLGIDAGRTHLTVAVTDLAGTRLHTERRDLSDADDTRADRRRVIVRTIGSALRKAGVGRERVVALCAGVPAPVDRQGVSPRHPSGFWERMNPDLTELLAAWAPFVRVENDASLAAVAEGAMGAAVGCRDYVALLAGDRLGAGVVVDGHLLRGRHGGVGEMLAFDHVHDVEGASGLGHRAREWALDLIERGDLAADSPLRTTAPAEVDGRLVLELAAAGDPDALRIAARVGATLARVVSVLGSMFDPQRVIVSGAISAGIGMIVDTAREALPADMHLPAPEMVVSQLGDEVVVDGAIAGAMDLARRNTLDLWLARQNATED